MVTVSGWESTIAILGLGCLLGARHALDADHVVAVSTLVSGTGSLAAAVRLGFLWGLGHTATLLLTGLPAVLLRLRVPAQAPYLEGAVAAMLVLLGVGTIRDHLRKRVHMHLHDHGGTRHAHFHRHDGEPGHGHVHALPARGRRSFFVGMVHGLAGSAALALLVMAAIPTPLLAAVYMLLFGLSSAAAMAAVTLVLALPFLWTGRRLPRLGLTIGLAAGATSVLLGLSLAWELVAG